MPQLIGLPEAARRLGLHPKHLQLLARTGKIAAEKVGRDWLVTPEEVERYRTAPKHQGGRPRKEQQR